MRSISSDDKSADYLYIFLCTTLNQTNEPLDIELVRTLKFARITVVTFRISAIRLHIGSMRSELSDSVLWNILDIV